VKIGLSREYVKRSEALHLGTTGQMTKPICPNGRSENPVKNAGKNAH
jgi:hypothetical protein